LRPPSICISFFAFFLASLRPLLRPPENASENASHFPYWRQFYASEYFDERLVNDRPYFNQRGRTGRTGHCTVLFHSYTLFSAPTLLQPPGLTQAAVQAVSRRVHSFVWRSAASHQQAHGDSSEYVLALAANAA
jgi:hypothetical protein